MVFITILLVIFFIYSMGGMLLNYFVKRVFSQSREKSQRKKKFDGGITLEHIPDDQKNSKEFNGGDYIDYEEIK